MKMSNKLLLIAFAVIIVFIFISIISSRTAIDKTMADSARGCVQAVPRITQSLHIAIE